MSAEILLDDTFPHGTTDGYGKGCRGRHCPGELSCRDVRARYIGDYGFRKAIDAGATVAEVLEQEREAARATVEAAKAAKAAAARQRHNASRKIARARKPGIEQPAVPMRDIDKHIRRLHSEGLLDAEIATQVGLCRRQITTIRDSLGLKPHRNIDKALIQSLHSDGLTDSQMVAHLNETRPRKLNRRSVAAIRLRLGLKPNPDASRASARVGTT